MFVCNLINANNFLSVPIGKNVKPITAVRLLRPAPRSKQGMDSRSQGPAFPLLGCAVKNCRGPWQRGNQWANRFDTHMQKPCLRLVHQNNQTLGNNAKVASRSDSILLGRQVLAPN